MYSFKSSISLYLGFEMIFCINLLNRSGNYRLIRLFERVFIFSNFSESKYFKETLSLFFYSRGINFSSIFFDFTFSDVTSIGNKFSVSFYKNVLFDVDNMCLKNYKMKLKLIIKRSFNLSLLSLIKLVNNEMEVYVKTFGFYYYNFITRHLDIYLYNLFWRFFKRLHPRRSSTWIFSKYWKFFSGVWKLCFFDACTKEIYFLRSHSDFKVCYFALPLLLRKFYIINGKKLFLTLFKRSRLFYKGIYKILYMKQLGLCYICKQPLNSLGIKLKSFSFSYFKQCSIKYFFLVHNYCFLV